MTVDGSHLLNTAPPRNPTTDADLACPLCGYALRGLTEPRCPECGYSFTWDEIRDPARRLHPYLFEHHPERNVSSFVRTLLGATRPRRFWTQLSPQTPSNPRRLRAYWLIGLLFALPAYALTIIGIARELHHGNAGARAVMAKQYAKPAAAAKFLAESKLTVPQYSERYYPIFPSARLFAQSASDMLPNLILSLTLAAVVWPWMTVLVMRMALWKTLRRARLHWIHLLRCVIHSADVAVWWWAALWLAAAYLFARSWVSGPAFLPRGMGGSPGHSTAVVAACAIAGALLVALYRLTIALRKYLRLPHAPAVVLLTQVIVMLGVLVVTGIAMELFRSYVQQVAYGV